MFSPVRELVGFTSGSTKPEVGEVEDYDHGILYAIFTLFVLSNDIGVGFMGFLQGWLDLRDRKITLVASIVFYARCRHFYLLERT
jgi:hypothetical protein